MFLIDCFYVQHRVLLLLIDVHVYTYVCMQGMKNPLDGLSVKQRDLPHLHDEQNIPSGGTFQYFLKVVPTTYTTLSNSTISSNQYSVTEHFKEPIAGPSRELPVRLHYFVYAID